ncbi:ArnT family glycosyltransferase [Lacticaseibacillus saniviri]|uniref:Glycosyltransferase n=1 Tax=Lacticaseibacillus saniviri JCM 17471 = DSM 24301 TaxID=1293598 RepID=A0A0R2MTB0_9LACO|nr:glycosyltransferase family 39 protein [Lacticaseibacillus saniviri]KRO15483.1 glycosyltransferase [Lacticaseibacillus saniviri JCM 17471 = DSM 24301]MCG4281311.1 glycosyltransferase family 39 protein [Lacticaseibacillus saniviri]
MKKRRIDWWLVAILILAAFLYGWNIWEATSANDYYTAAITSMIQSFHNFWYGAFDPAGFITVDKPPVALWFMAISAKIFGVHGWSVVLPSILFGIGSVALLYAMIKPYFGPWSARLAALVMTLTPIVVADSRTNNMDATLVFFLLLAGYLLLKAVDRQKAWMVVVSFGLIGVAFNIKMLQAFMILPAMFFFYWIASRQNWKKKILTLVMASAALAGLTLAWPVAVDSTAASERPYVGSSQTNSMMELAFGYNGTERLLGQTTGTGGAFPGMGSKSKESTTGGMPAAGGTGAEATAKPQMGGTPPSGFKGSGKAPTNGQGPTGQKPPSGTRPSGTPMNGATESTANKAKAGTPPSGAAGMKKPSGKMGGGMGGGNNAFSIGTAGPLRILQSDLGPQISWLLPAALIGIISAYAYFYDRKRKWYQTNRQQQHIWYWVAWLVPVAGFFSVAGFFHPYYTIMLAPPIAALVGIGLVTMFKQFKQQLTRWTAWLLPITLVVTVGLQAWYVSMSYTWQMWLVIVAEIVALGILFAGRKGKGKLGVIAALVAMLAAPAWWSLTPTLAGESAGIPYAGPALLQQGGQSGGIGSGTVDSGLLSYVTKHQGNAKYLFATSDASTAAPYIIKTGKAVMAIGGFNGTDPAITLKQFKALVKAGKLKYFYDSGKSGNSAIVKWVEKNGKKISSSKYSSTKQTQANGMQGGFGGMSQGTLYQLK